MITNIWQRLVGSSRAEARVPDGYRVYAIGDIHGRLDLLQAIHTKILRDAASSPSALSKAAVYLGDYVDRGLQSKEVIDLLLDSPLPGFDTVHLKGNHEEAMLEFLEDASVGPGWLRFGGNETLYSYGVRVPTDVPAAERPRQLQIALREALPQSHVKFLSSLRLSLVIGDYAFVHAGIRPGVTMDKQVAEDLLWIRGDFLDSKRDHGKVIVHGHTITREPAICANRIGIDTGAYASNVLSCLVLEGSSRRVITS